MPELDFHGLRDEIDRIVQQPDFGTVRRRAGRLRTRARVAAATGVLGVLTVLALAAVTVVPSLASLRMPAGPAGGERALVTWAGAGDRDHLYAVLADCAGCPQRLVASADAGRTWRTRAQFPSRSGSAPVTPTVLGPEFLVVNLPVGEPGKGSGSTIRRISTDGGATWRDAGPAGTARASAVPGTRIWGCVVYVAQGCDIVVPDPASGRLAPLVTQPPLDAAVPADAPPSAGYWVRGCDPATGRPAIAVSRTGGRSWATHVFARQPVAAAPDGCAFDLATTDGRTVFALFPGDGTDPPRIYRSTDGVAWHAVEGPRLPDGWSARGASLVAGDGSHVLLAQHDSRSGLLVSRDGRSYTPLAGDVPVMVERVPQAVAEDRYLCYDEAGVYLSDDAVTWRSVLLP